MSARASIPELQRRLIFSLLWPAVAVCRRFQVPLDVLERLCRLAYYEELRRGGKLTQVEVARIFGTSLRTVVAVERKYRGGFLAPEYEVELYRRVEEALTVRSTTAEDMAVQLEADEDAVRRTLDGLVGAGRAEATPAGDTVEFSFLERHPSLVRADLLSRIDGLKHQLEVLVSAVSRRFFDEGDTGKRRPSVARTVSFLGISDDVEALADELVRMLRLRAIDVEERALRKGGHERYGLTMALAATEDTRNG